MICCIYLRQHLEICPTGNLAGGSVKAVPITTSMLCIVVLISLAQLTSAIARPQQDRDVCVPSFRSFLHLPSRHNVCDFLIADLPSCQHSGGNVKHVKRLGISSDKLVPSGADHFNSPYLAHLWCTMV